MCKCIADGLLCEECMKDVVLVDEEEPPTIRNPPRFPGSNLIEHSVADTKSTVYMKVAPTTRLLAKRRSGIGMSLPITIVGRFL